LAPRGLKAVRCRGRAAIRCRQAVTGRSQVRAPGSRSPCSASFGCRPPACLRCRDLGRPMLRRPIFQGDGTAGTVLRPLRLRSPQSCSRRLPRRLSAAGSADLLSDGGRAGGMGGPASPSRFDGRGPPRGFTISREQVHPEVRRVWEEGGLPLVGPTSAPAIIPWLFLTPAPHPAGSPHPVHQCRGGLPLLEDDRSEGATQPPPSGERCSGVPVSPSGGRGALS